MSHFWGALHTAPLGQGDRASGFYKHTAPLGQRDRASGFYKHTAPLGQGDRASGFYKHSAPLGQGDRASGFYKHSAPLEPAEVVAPATNMLRRWGRIQRLPAVGIAGSLTFDCTSEEGGPIRPSRISRYKC